MKKKLFIFASILISMLMIFAPTKDIVLADNLNPEHIAVIGVGEVCVNANIAEIKFMLICKEQTIEEVSKCVEEKKQNIVNALSATEENLTTEISNLRSVFENGMQMFEKMLLLSYKTSNLENIDETINTLISNGAIYNGNICYSIEDYKSEYNKALQLAKEDAIEKANLLGNNLTLEKICEEYFCYCNYSSTDNCIKIEARIKAVFESETSDEITEFETETSKELTETESETQNFETETDENENYYEDENENFNYEEQVDNTSEYVTPDENNNFENNAEVFENNTEMILNTLKA